jgi:hypothetical protein
MRAKFVRIARVSEKMGFSNRVKLLSSAGESKENPHFSRKNLARNGAPSSALATAGTMPAFHDTKVLLEG